MCGILGGGEELQNKNDEKYRMGIVLWIQWVAEFNFDDDLPLICKLGNPEGTLKLEILINATWKSFQRFCGSLNSFLLIIFSQIANWDI